MLLNPTVIIIGYLLGSFPSAYIVAKLRKGIDIRQVGVGNMGAANVIREIGFWEGVVVWLADAAKGAAAMLVALALDVPHLWLLGAGFAALLGHSFPIYIGFKGGVGSATAMGIFAVIAPREMGIALGIIVIDLLITRDAHKIALALTIGFAFIPLLIWLFQASAMLAFYSLAVLTFIGIKARRTHPPETPVSDGKP